MALTKRLYRGSDGLAAVQPGLVILSGQALIGAGGDVVEHIGKAFQVEHVQEGGYFVYLPAGVPAVLHITPHIDYNNDTTRYWAFARAYSQEHGIIGVETVLASDPTVDVDPPEGSYLSFNIVVRNVGIRG